MTGWIVYDSRQYERNRWFAQELMKNCKRFCDVRLIMTEGLRFGIDSGGLFLSYENQTEQMPDFVIMRTIFPLLSTFFEAAGAKVFNDSATSRVCNDKRLTHLSVMRLGVGMMDASFYSRDYLSEENLQAIRYPAVVKSASGHGGKEVYFAEDREDLIDAVNAMRDPRFLVQKPFSPAGQDLRVYVLGGKIIGAALRTSDTLKSNISLGGKATAHTLTSRERDTVGAVLKALPFSPDFIGIDFLYGADELIFNEIEDVVGTRMLYETTDLDAAALYVSYIKKQTEIKSHH